MVFLDWLFEEKKPNRARAAPKRFPGSDEANDWMTFQVIYYEENKFDPCTLFSPACGDYMPCAVHVGSSWKPEHQEHYRKLKAKYPAYVAGAKKITTGIAGRISLSSIGDPEDYYGMTIDN